MIYNGNYFRKIPGLISETEQSWKFEKILPALKIFFSNNSKDKVRILDIGAGSGMIAKKIKQEFKDKKIDFYFFEINPEAKNLILKNLSQAKIFQLDITKKTPFPNQYFDLSLAIDVIEHTVNPDLALKEIKRISSYAIFKIPAEKTIGTVILNTISFNRYRKLAITQTGHLHWFWPAQIKLKIKQLFKENIYFAFADLSKYQLKKNLTAMTVKKTLPFMRYGISVLLAKISPTLNAWIFYDHLIFLVKCH